MKVAVVGSRSLNVRSIKHYLPAATTEIVSGGAKGVDTKAQIFSKENNLVYTEFLPDYKKYGKAAPLKRNDEIIDYADLVVAIWDSKSKGTKYVIDKCKKIRKSLIVYSVYVCEGTNILLTGSCDYYNMTDLGDEMLKKIIVAELDGELYLDIDVELINECIGAILINKPDLKSSSVAKNCIAGFKAKNEEILREITDKYCKA